VTEKKFKHVCECTNCGNEAEMVVTCTLVEESPKAAEPKVVSKDEGKTKGHAVCSHCGGESDIWLDV
jgi:5-methylcytosine-specific restriction endonuclease McrA